MGIYFQRLELLNGKFKKECGGEALAGHVKQ